jgi:hypothetical protein
MYPLLSAWPVFLSEVQPSSLLSLDHQKKYLGGLTWEYKWLKHAWQLVPKIHYQESSVISDVHRIAVVILLLYPLTAKEDYRSTHGSVVQFSYVFQHPYIVHQHVMCFFSGYIKEGSNTTIVRLYSVGCLIFNSKMVPKCLHVCVPHCFLGWLRTQWQTIDINKSLNICRIAS